MKLYNMNVHKLADLHELLACVAFELPKGYQEKLSKETLVAIASDLGLVKVVDCGELGKDVSLLPRAEQFMKG